MTRTESPSSLNTYKTCPAQYNYRYNLKRPRVPSEAMQRGSLVHRWIEETVSGDTPAYSVADFGQEKQNAVHEFLSMLSEPWEVFPEVKWAVSGDLKSILNFDDPSAKVRGVIDLLAVHKPARKVLLVDWKSGSYFAELFQLEAYALAASIVFPGFDVSAWFFYVDKIRGDREKEADLRPPEEIRGDIEETVAKIAADTTWRGCSDWHCNWCDFKAECSYAAGKVGQDLVGVGVLEGLCSAT